MVAALTGVFGADRIELVEDVVQEALLAALRHWRFHGVPENPRAWLVRVARNRALDVLRREAALMRKAAHVREWAEQAATEPSSTRSGAAGGGGFDEIHDDVLRMMFICCHPAIPRDARVALTLKTVGGFGVSEIARAFLCSRQAVAQRIVRARRGLREQRPAFELPPAEELSARLDSVLDVVYLMFNEGYAAHEGERLIRSDLMAEAMRLAALLLQSSATARPKVHALLAMMCFHAARSAARTGALGELVLLDEQDRTRWDRRLIAGGFQHLRAAADGEELTAYHLEAGVASCHAAAESFSATDWGRIVGFYDQLAEIAASPVVMLNRAVATAMAAGVEAGLAELGRIADRGELKDYYLLPATRGELLRRAGRVVEAAEAFRAALRRPCSEPERRLIALRLERCHEALGR